MQLLESHHDNLVGEKGKVDQRTDEGDVDRHVLKWEKYLSEMLCLSNNVSVIFSNPTFYLCYGE